MKRTFKYTDLNGTVQTDINIYSGEEHQEYFSKLLQMEKRFYLRIGEHFEKPWRNLELSRTDWFLLPDATYKGELVKDTSYYTDILLYRDALRKYVYSSNEPRPTAPTWY